MDAESFLAAQLWLHALHPDAWPAEGSPPIASGAAATAAATQAAASTFSDGNSGHGLDKVILSDARCCLLLSDDIAATNERRHRLRFLATNARQPRESAVGFRGNPGGVRARVQGREGHNGVRKSGRQELPRPEGEGVDWTGEFDFELAIVQGLVPTSDGDRAGVAAEAGLGSDCGVKEAVPSPRKSGGRPRDSGNGGSSSSNVSKKRGGILLLRIDGRVYQVDHTLIRRIAYPRDRGKSTGGNVADSRVRDEEKPNQTENIYFQGCSGTAIPREKSPTLREDMGAGYASSQVDPLKDLRDFRSGSCITVGGRSSFLSKATVTPAASDRLEIESGVDTVAGVSRKRRKLGAAGVDGVDDVVRGLEERHGHGSWRGERGVDGVNGYAGGSSQSVLRRRCERGVSSSENCKDDVRGGAAEGEGRRGTANCNRRDCHGCDCGNCGGVTVANSRQEFEEGNGGILGSGDSSEGTLFCGLLFPGVFLKFWVRGIPIGVYVWVGRRKGGYFSSVAVSGG